ncbi:MAG: glycine cleavage system protein H [Gemmataceae bacterium]
MAEPLIFWMGKQSAPIPPDLRYCKNHMWCRPGSGSTPHRFGFTSYAVRLMQDVYFLEWKVDLGATLRPKHEIGFIESSKAQSELYSPMPGTLVRFNPELLDDPAAINADCYGAGWLFELAGPLGESFDAPGYLAHLEAHWEQTQRLLKKQIHMDDEPTEPA